MSDVLIPILTGTPSVDVPIFFYRTIIGRS